MKTIDFIYSCLAAVAAFPVLAGIDDPAKPWSYFVHPVTCIGMPLCAAEVAHRWSFNGDWADSVGGAEAVKGGTFANATGALTLSGDATIDLGDGSLSFADSSGETWANGATLNITGPEGWPVRSVRFGTNGAGLSAAQIRRIRYNGGKVSLNSEGYLSGPKGLIISFH